MSPPRRVWRGNGGTISKISATLPGISYHKVARVIKETVDCEMLGKKYEGTRNERKHKGTYLIQPGSVHEQMLRDFIETSLGLNHTALLLNKELQKEN